VAGLVSVLTVNLTGVSTARLLIRSLTRECASRRMNALRINISNLEIVTIRLFIVKVLINTVVSASAAKKDITWSTLLNKNAKLLLQSAQKISIWSTMYVSKRLKIVFNSSLSLVFAKPVNLLTT